MSRSASGGLSPQGLPSQVAGDLLELRWRCGVMTRLQILVLGLVGVLAAGSPLFAHHSWPVDQGKEVTVKGTVTGYDWGNPHVMIGLDVTTANGKVEKWNAGGPSTTRMANNGWDRTTLKPG